MNKVQILTPVDPKVKAWVTKLRPLVGDAIHSIVKLGAELDKAYLELDDKEKYAEVLKRIGIGDRYARAFRCIAKNKVIAGRNHDSVLPPHPMTLEILARLNDDEMERAISNGKITPQTKRKEARCLVERSDDASVSSAPSPSGSTGPSTKSRDPMSKGKKQATDDTMPEGVIELLTKACAAYDGLNDDDDKHVVMEEIFGPDSPEAVNRFLADVVTFYEEEKSEGKVRGNT
jgi:hypothetical protein